MQNKTAIWLFTILLAIACLYQLSFGWVVSGVEAEAKEYALDRAEEVEDSIKRLVPKQYAYNVGKQSIYFIDSTETNKIDSAGLSELQNYFEQQYLINRAEQPVYPLFGHTYQYCKNHQLNLGLDLQGGMSVTLEVSRPDLVRNLAGKQAQYQTVFMNPFNAAYEEHSQTDENFIDLFKKHWDRQDPDEKMTRFFSVGSKDKFDDELTNEQVIEILHRESALALDRTEEVIMTRINKFGVSQPAISKQPASGRIHLELPGVKDAERARKLIIAPANLEFWPVAAIDDPAFGESMLRVKKRLLDERSMELNQEIASFDSAMVVTTTPFYDSINGVPVLDSNEQAVIDTSRAPLVDTSWRAYSKQERDSLIAQQLNGSNPWDDLVKGASPYFGVMGSVAIKDTAAVNNIISNKEYMTMLPSGVEFLWSYKPELDENDDAYKMTLYAISMKSIDGKARITGDHLDEARYGFDQNAGGIEIQMIMTDDGANEWCDWTTTQVQEAATGYPGRPIAIVMDNMVYSAPSINDKICQGISSITGKNIDADEAEDLVTVLNGGSLPARSKIVDEATVGPTLGKENIESGMMSFVIAIALVLIYMIFYYAKAGVVSDIALVANIFFIIGTLASLGAALTLPGIAGIVLTIGMSVDANVLIYERIREEVRAGKGTRLAITDGYKHAYSAIVDANLTTLFTAIVLAYFGSGPIQGFAITLIIGIFTSLFSAIFITRLIFTYMLERKQNISFSSKATEKVFANANYKFIKKRKIFYVISALIILGGIGSLATRGLDAGVEFSGGRKYKVKFEQGVQQENLKVALTGAFDNMPPEVKSFGNTFQYEITTKYRHTDKGPDGNELVKAALDEGVKGFGEYQIMESRQVDATITRTLMTSSLIAIVLSLVVIFVYIAFRFRKWQYGLGALLAMFHDVLVVLSLFSIFWGILPFSMEIDQAFIAAILTVVGYSINDTVVVFDRIREYLGVHRKQDHKEVINKALNSTLSRTVNTSLSTFIVLLVIFIFADSIRGFTFALMVGVIVGTYSSLCIATPSVVDLSKNFDANKKKKKS